MLHTYNVSHSSSSTLLCTYAHIPDRRTLSHSLWTKIIVDNGRGLLAIIFGMCRNELDLIDEIYPHLSQELGGPLPSAPTSLSLPCSTDHERVPVSDRILTKQTIIITVTRWLD